MGPRTHLTLVSRSPYDLSLHVTFSFYFRSLFLYLFNGVLIKLVLNKKVVRILILLVTGKSVNKLAARLQPKGHAGKNGVRLHLVNAEMVSRSHYEVNPSDLFVKSHAVFVVRIHFTYSRTKLLIGINRTLGCCIIKYLFNV